MKICLWLSLQNGRSDSNASIDEPLSSRQVYVLGHDALARLSVANVLVSGLGGLGVEVAKDVILAGVRSVTLHDTRDVAPLDLGTQVINNSAAYF